MANQRAILAMKPLFVFTLLAAMATSVWSHSVPDIAKRLEQLLAQTPAEFSAAEFQDYIDQQLARRALPSGSDHVIIAETLIQQHPQIFEQTPTDWQRLTLASINQYNHRFATTLEQLLQIPPTSRYWTGAMLMKARTEVMLGEFEAAEASCKSLLLKASTLIVSACLSDARSNQDANLQAIIRQALSSQTAFQPQDASFQHTKQGGFSQAEPKAAPQSESRTLPRYMDVWLSQLHAEYLEQQSHHDTNNHQQAFKVLDSIAQRYPADSLPVAFWAQWADSALATQQYQAVIHTLPRLYAKDSLMDDALMLRVSEAWLHSQPRARDAKRWKSLIAHRIHYRLHNQASVHAYEISRYYHNIKGNHTKALHWARANLNDNRSWRDQQWLQQVKNSR